MRFSYYFIAVIILALFYTYLVSDYISGFKSLPSPLFGGDYYFQLGAIHHMYESSIPEWFKSSNMLGQLPAYLPTYGVVVTIFGKIFSLDPMHAMLDLNYILPFLSVIFVFFFIKSLFNSEKIALLGSMLLVSFTSFPILKYTNFTTVVLVPLFFYSLWLFYKEQNKKNAIILGLMYIIMAFAHTTSFAYSTIMILFLFVLILFEKYLDSKENFSLKNESLKLAPFFAYSFVLGFLVSQIIWFVPIFVYHGHSELGNNIWGTPDVKVFSVGFDIFISNLKSMFFNLSSILSLVISIFSAIGLYLLIKTPRKSKVNTFLLFLFTITFILVYSYFITSTLFDFHLAPTYMFPMYLYPISIIIALFFINKKLLKYKYSNIILILLFILISYNWYTSYNSWMSNRWIINAKQPLSTVYLNLQSYLLKNSNVNDVILSNDELSFVINAISGRKLVISRRSQNDPFMDFDQRELDAALMFYGDNLENKIGLMKKYNIKYIYYDANWFQEYNYNNKHKIINYFDPLMLFYSKNKETILKNNNIKYFVVHGYVDPAIRRKEIRTYNLILISPDNYNLQGYGPWKPDIDPYLTLVWSYKDNNNQVVAALYKVNYP